MAFISLKEVEHVDKFAGVGLKNIFLIWLCTIAFGVIAKVILTKHHVNGLSEVVLAGA